MTNIDRSLSTEVAKGQKPNGAAPTFSNNVLSREPQVERTSKIEGQNTTKMPSKFATSAAKSMKSSRDYVSENPVRGVVYAAAAGIVAGGLLTMAMRGRKN